ncbi:hypothetical protein QJS10_CPA01g00664 [Acorus calamus]|uniref:Uncharacterized protein n=1 Tax=Acorus calamus TaxID=4465 RepID=A0AAV9FLL7_ACOCL|nr:hypothetical protein QJS10_CPA01g00664 [Acorus calamus]
MIANRLLRSKAYSQAGTYIRNVLAAGRSQEPFSQCYTFARMSSSEASLPSESKEDKGFKGHDMLAPFTAGWQSNDLHPLLIDKSEGSYVYDINGKKYLDSLAGLWCTALGGNEPRLVAAATKQLNTLPFYHSFWNRTTKPSLDLAKEILEIFTARKMGKVFFTNSGSEANDSQYTPGETEEEFSTRLANNLENLILKEGPDTIAAFIAEPVMGAGGVITPPKTYFEKIQAVVKKYDILFIADEIRGTGLILGTEFTDNKSPNDPFPAEWGVGAYFGAQCEKHGMLVRVSGDNIMMSPPFIITPEEVDELISIYGKALKETEERIKELKALQKN